MSKVFEALILGAVLSLTISFSPQLALGQDPFAACDIQTRTMLEAAQRTEHEASKLYSSAFYNLRGQAQLDTMRRSGELSKEADRLRKEYNAASQRCMDNVRAVLRQKQDDERKRREDELRRADAEKIPGELSGLLLDQGVKDTKSAALNLLLKSLPSGVRKLDAASGSINDIRQLVNDFRQLSSDQSWRDKYNSVVDIASKLNWAGNSMTLSARLTSDALDRMKEIHLSAFDQFGAAIKSFDQDFNLGQSGRSSFGLGRGGAGSWEGFTKRFDAAVSQVNQEFRLRLENTQRLPETNLNRQIARLNSSMEEINRQYSARPPVRQQDPAPASEDERLARERAKKEAQALDQAAREADERRRAEARRQAEEAARARAARQEPTREPAAQEQELNIPHQCPAGREPDPRCRTNVCGVRFVRRDPNGHPVCGFGR